MDVKLLFNKKNLMRKTNIIFFIVFVLLAFIDQMSKYIAARFLKETDIVLIPDVLELHYLENKGAAWGIMQGQMWILVSVTILVLAVIIIAFLWLPPVRKFTLLRFCLVLLAAGALGNFIDRIMNQYVVDFIYFSLINFPVFNLADCFVCISAALILYCLLIKYKDEDFKQTAGDDGIWDKK